MLGGIFFGSAFTILTCYSMGRLFLWRFHTPAVMALPVGAAMLSVCAYALLLLGAATRASFLALGICAVLPLLWRNHRPRQSEQREPAGRAARWALAAVFLIYGALYLVYAVAPEVQPDAVYYHLGLVAEYYRLGSFPKRIDFYNILPQGMEMLYLFAFSFGRHSAAKLVHFTFLIATVPVMLAVGRRLGLSDSVCWIAAAFYFCAPVVGISGTCAYTDAGLVCCVLATFYFLIAWRQEGDAKYLISAGLSAGFCYAIKLNGIVVPALAGLFVLFACQRSLRLAVARSALFAAAALAVIAPWMIRSIALTGNPLAPMFNSWFPNPFFLVTIERGLAQFMRTYQGFTFRNAPWELTVGGASHGTVGPLFLLLPVGLLALRRGAGRWLWLAGGLMALPWLLNVGTRFLMPSLPFFALALAMALPRPVAWSALVFHAVLCWPSVLAHYERPGLWRLWGFPWQAALRVQSERDYLRGQVDYRVAEMLNRETGPESKILALATTWNAYIDREIIQYWQSSLGTQMRETILEAAYTPNHPLYSWIARWPAQPLRALRFRTLTANQYEWEIHEASILLDGDRLHSGAEWKATAWPSLFEVSLALDRNLATRWRTWDPERPGMFFEIDFGRQQSVSGAAIASHWETPQIEVLGMGVEGKWQWLSNLRKSVALPNENLRHASMRFVKRAGVDYILTPVEGSDGGVWLGKDLENHSAEYGITEIGRQDTMRLYKLGKDVSNIAAVGP